MASVKVKPDVQCVVFDERTNSHIALTPGAEFDSGDPVVKANQWAFHPAADAPARRRIVSVGVEQATAAPGELR